MKVVIAAAGRGTRMKELTKDTSKHLIQVLGHPFLYYLLENIKKAGYFDILVVTGHKGQQITDFLKDYDPSIKTINQFEVLKNEYGTACPVRVVKEEIGNENFVLINGDSLYSPLDLKKFKKNDFYTYIGAIKSDVPEKYGVLETQGKFLKSITEKPEFPASNLINTGCYKFSFEIFEELEKIKPSSRGELELTDAIKELAQKNRVKVQILEDYWYDFGSPEDIKIMEEFLSINNPI